MRQKTVWARVGFTKPKSSDNLCEWLKNHWRLIFWIISTITAISVKITYGDAFDEKEQIFSFPKLILSLADTYFILLLVIIGNLFLLSKKEKNGDIYRRNFNSPYNTRNIAIKGGIIFLLSFFGNTFNIIHSQSLVYFLGFISFLLLVRIVIDDFKVHNKKELDLRYFYPSIISILILLYVIAQMEQFNTLFIELIRRPRNLLFFLFLFGFSVNVIWFTPSLLRFTDIFINNFPINGGNEKDSHKVNYGLLFLHSKHATKSKKKLSKPEDTSEPSNSINKKISNANKAQKERNIANEQALVPNTENKFKKYKESNTFAFISLCLGLFYMAILATLAIRVYLKSLGPEHEKYAIIIMFASFVVPFIYAHYLFSKNTDRKESREIVHDDESKKIWADFKQFLSIKYKKFNLRPHLFFFLSSLTFIVYVFYDSRQSFSDSAFINLGFLSLLTLFFSIPFIKNAVFIHLERLQLFDRTDKGAIDKRKADEAEAGIDKLNENKNIKAKTRIMVSLILILNWIFVLMFLSAFLLALFLPFSSFISYVENVNAMNIYLLFVNGFIAFIVIIDRIFSIQDFRAKYASENNATEKQGFLLSRLLQKFFSTLHLGLKFIIYKILLLGFLLPQKEFKEIQKARPSSLFWTYFIGLLILSIYFNKYLPNHYHYVAYLPEKPGYAQALGSMESYTHGFLDKLEAKESSLVKKDTTNKSPIIFIAADGGGLKSAYWTLKVLNHLDTLGLYDNIYMLSGASGGGIGQGVFTYMKARAYQEEEKNRIIEELGKTNFISADLVGLFSRWPMHLIPDIESIPKIDNWVARRQNRMEAMSEYYFNLIHKIADENQTYNKLRKEPFASLWKNPKTPLPLYIVNTSKAEEGINGWVHPFKKDVLLEAGIEDLSRLVKRADSLGKTETSYISFPDAMFLTNRFPLLSPVAKIEGKGHFIDGGAVDNSGTQSIVRILVKLKALKSKKIEEKFFNRKIIVLSIRNTKSRFIDTQFKHVFEECFEHPKVSSELSSNLSTIISSGLTGAPKEMDEILADGEIASFFGIEFRAIDLPARLVESDLEDHFKRDISEFCSKEFEKISRINTEIYKAYKEDYKKDETVRLIEPPLGRVLSEPSRIYMNKMLSYKDNQEIFSWLSQTNSLENSKKEDSSK